MSVSITSTNHRHQNKNSCKQNKNRTEKVEEIAKKLLAVTDVKELFYLIEIEQNDRSKRNAGKDLIQFSCVSASFAVFAFLLSIRISSIFCLFYNHLNSNLC